ncbi:MAG: hypothetical protein EBR23_02325 [Planctomycetia bacterium]|nr:hypothetical protein [Planctomycetia bacterium]
MHAASITLLAWAMIGAACCFPSAAAIPVGGVLAVLVAVVGLPHGAADHRFARRRLEPLLGPAWGSVFLLAYLAIASGVVLGWFFEPAATILVFFMASAWHFGQEEPDLAFGPRGAKPLRPVFRVARGGLVIWVPVAFQTNEVVRILSLTAPRGAAPQIQWAVDALVVCSWAMLAIEVVAVVWQSLSAVASRGRRRRILLLDVLMLLSLMTVLAMNPIVGFLVYFCGWHSARGLRRLRRELGESWWQLAMSLAPLTALSIALIALSTCLVLQAPTWNDTLIRSTFVGLSGVAVPHLVLHGVGSVIDRVNRHHAAPTVGLGSAA